MPRITYYPVDFDPRLGKEFRGPRRNLQTSFAELLWAAITVGRASWSKVLQYGLYSVFEIVYRGSMLYAYLDESSNKLGKTEAYRDLDPSEKSAISYFIALTMAKLFAGRRLGVAWLMHLDVYKNQLNPILSGDSRPDLVGTDRSGRWIVIEAKGRTGNIDSQTKSKAKEQARQLRKINGKKPYLRIGLVSYFNGFDQLVMYIQDPPEDEEKSTVLEIETNRMVYDYYRMFSDLIRSDYGRVEEHREGSQIFITKYITEIDAWIGLDQSIYSVIASTNPEHPRVEQVIAAIPEKDQPLAALDSNHETVETTEAQEILPPSRNFVGNDGVFVGLGDRWLAKHNV